MGAKLRGADRETAAFRQRLNEAVNRAYGGPRPGRVGPLSPTKSREELAAAIGCSPDLVKSWFRVTRPSNPTIPKLRAIAEATGVSLHWLITGEGGAYPGTDQEPIAIEEQFRALVVGTLKSAGVASDTAIDNGVRPAAHILNTVVRLSADDAIIYADDSERFTPAVALASVREDVEAGNTTWSPNAHIASRLNSGIIGMIRKVEGGGEPVPGRKG